MNSKNFNIKIIPFNLCGQDIVCGISKGTTQYILPIHWKMSIYFDMKMQELSDARANKCFF